MALRTKAQALAWLNGGWKNDKYARRIWINWVYRLGIDVDGYYGFQCADFANAYSLFLVGYRFWGNAINFATQTPRGWRKVSWAARQPGDMLVYGTKYGPYGHVEMLVTKDKAMGQNSVRITNNGWPPAVRTVNGYGVIAILRPQYAASKPAWPKTVTVTSTAYVRSAPKTSAPVAGSKILYRGNTFMSVGLVVGQSINGNNKWHKSSLGRYVWSGNTNVRS